MAPTATLLPDGKRLHLHHGPIDLIISAEGERQVAFDAAVARFETVLSELAAELPVLRKGLTAKTTTPKGAVAQRMHHAALPFSEFAFVTRMPVWCAKAARRRG